MHEKFYGLLAPRAANCADDAWLCTALPITHIVKNHFDMKVYIIFAFIMLILNDASKIDTF